MNNLKTLAESKNFLLCHEFEQVYVIDKVGHQRLKAGDHYGDPTCGIISRDECWFATGGQGVVVFTFRGGVQSYLRSIDSTFQISAMRLESRDDLRILVDPWSDVASVWRLNPETAELTKLRDGPDLREEPYTDNVAF